MPKKQTTASQRAREIGGKHTETLRQVREAQPAVPDRFARAQQYFRDGMDALRELNQDPPEDRDPYRRAALLDTRAGVWMELAEAAPAGTPDEFRQAAHYAAILDQEQAAQIRYAAGIPTPFPGTQRARLHLADMLCRSCGQPWQTDRPCPRCPRILFGATPRSREDAAKFPPGTPWPADDDERQAEPPAEDLAALVQRAAEERESGVRRPRWHATGNLTIRALNRLYQSTRPSPLRAEWRTLVEQLADVRGELAAQQAARDASHAAAAALHRDQDDEDEEYSRYRLGFRAAEQNAGETGTAFEQTRLRYVQLAVHALAAAAGEASALALPEEVPMGDPRFVEPEPRIPEALAARGFALTAVHNAMPESAARARQLQEDFEDEFGRGDDHECNGLILDGRCDCDPISIPEHMLGLAEAISDEIGLALEADAEEEVVWADAVCVALATELRTLLRD